MSMPGSGSTMRAMTHADFFWRVKLAGAGDAALGELADEIFVAAADDVGLDVVEAQDASR